MATPASVSGFHLSAELRGHEQDVRGVRSCPLGILTSSRDKSMKLWVEETPNTYQETATFVGHTDYVGPIVYIGPNASPDYPAGAIVTGSRDKTLIVWDIGSASVLAKLEGHSYQVTAVGLLPSGEIVSASLDKTLKLWKDGKCSATLSGHEGPVLSMIVLPDTGEIISGSGDTTIRVWGNGKCTKTITGHTDTVRSLAVLPNIGFVSGSHDLSVKVWTLDGEILSELLGHTAIIFCVAATDSGIIASGSDDNTVRLWQASGQCLQVLEHPGCIWDVNFTNDGDLMSGCSDAIARIWSSKADRKAPVKVIAAHDGILAELKAAAAAAAAESEAGAGGDDGVTALPPGMKVEDASTLLQPGSKEGQTKIIKEANGAVNAYAWDSNAFQWEKIGEVVGAPSGGARGKKMHQGKEWDFVFDVDIGDDMPVKKLPFDLSENPYIAADRFLEAEELPPSYKDQIVQFIIQNSGLDKPTVPPANMDVTGGFCDPFTGGASSSGPQRPPMAPMPSLDSLPVTGGGFDPFSGGSSAPDAGGPGGQLMHVPACFFMAFDNAPPAEALGRKLREFNAALAGTPTALSEIEIGAHLDSLLQCLAAAVSPVATTSTNLTTQHLALAAKLLAWPPAQLFPALDVARCVALDPSGAAALVAGAGPMGGSAADLGLVAAALSCASAAEPAVLPNQQMGLRLACNLFKQPATRAWVLSNRAALLDAYAHCCQTQNKAVRVSMATLLYNYSVNSSTSMATDDEAEAKMQILSALSELLMVVPMDDVDSTFRALVAVGTLCHGDDSMVSLAKDLGVQEALQRLNDSAEAKTPAGRKLLEAAIDVSSILKAKS